MDSDLNHCNSQRDLGRDPDDELADRCARPFTQRKIDGTNARIDVTNTRLEVVEHTVRDLAEQMHTVTRYIKNVASRHEDAIEDLRVRVGKLETRGA